MPGLPKSPYGDHMSEDKPGPISNLPLLSSVEAFLFGAPLYAIYDLDSVEEGAYRMLVTPVVVDGHCPECGRASTFRRTAGEIDILKLDDLVKRRRLWLFQLTCARNETHKIDFLLRFEEGLVLKIGQFPSLADIANDESRAYRQVLMPEDGAELHRAIGLAAHGVGVGSFVYLRRVFERLIARRFDEFKADERWTDADFVGKRMEEKIELLEDHLPDFLVRNKKIYGILSKGIHELREDECLSAFEMLKQAIFFILDEDRHKKEELERRRRAEEAIAKFR